MKMNDTERGTTNRSSNGKGGEASVPASAKEIVLSLKEIVNYPDHEIYAMLKECNMDPNDAIQRLLSQDPFHEVKRRREKRKEIKEPLEYKPRGTSSRGGRTGIDRVIAHAGATQYGSSESGVIHSKLGQKKENEMNVVPSTSTFSTSTAANSEIRRFDSTSDFPAVESTRHTGDLYGGARLYSQPISGERSAYIGTPGQVSMADIVRSGRPGSKPSSLPVLTVPTSQTMNANPLQLSSHGAKQSFVGTPIPSMSQHELLISHNPSSKIQGTLKHEPDVAATQHVTSDDDQSPMNASSVSDPSGASVVYMDLNGLPNFLAEVSLNSSCPVDELSATEQSVAVQPLSVETSGTALGSCMHMVMENLAVQHDSSHFDDSHFDGCVSCQAQELNFEDSQGVRDGVAHSLRSYRRPASVEDVKAGLSSNVAKLQQLQLLKEESEDNMAVKMPNHLQDPSVDFSHLSFGSFGSGISAAFSARFSAQASKDDREETSKTIISSSLGECVTRNSEYSESDQPQAAASENFPPRSSSLENFDSAPSQSEVVKDDNDETKQVQHFPYPSSVPNYALENAVQATVSAYPYELTNSSRPNPSTLMQSYGSSYQGSFLASSAQPARESEFSLSSFRATQSMATRYSSTVSNIGGPSIATPEVAKPSLFSSQSSARTILGGNLQSTQAPPLHVPLQTYSQPAALPVEHFGNMLSYSCLPQSFTYSPFAFQNSGYHSSAASVHEAGMRYSLPQYKSSMPMDSLIPLAAVAAGYGGFGSSANFPRNFALNPSSSGATPASYDDILASQFKDRSHLLSIPQNETPGMWSHAAGSRSVSALPKNTYYTLQGQTQESILQQISERATSGYTNPDFKGGVLRLSEHLY